MEEIMSCPWCGEMPKMHITAHGVYWLECETETCPVKPMSQAFSRKEKLIKMWNRREVVK